MGVCAATEKEDPEARRAEEHRASSAVLKRAEAVGVEPSSCICRSIEYLQARQPRQVAQAGLDPALTESELAEVERREACSVALVVRCVVRDQGRVDPKPNEPHGEYLEGSTVSTTGWPSPLIAGWLLGESALGKI